MSFSSQASIDLRTAPEQVWAAITKPELVKQYFFGTNLETDWVVGHPIFFRGEWEGKAYEDKGVVLSFEPMSSLSYSYWSGLSGQEDKPELYQVITMTLEPQGEITRLTLAQSNVPTQEAANHSASNWQLVFDGLKKLLETPTAQ